MTPFLVFEIRLQIQWNGGKQCLITLNHFVMCLASFIISAFWFSILCGVSFDKKKTSKIMVFWMNILSTYEYLVTWQTDTHTHTIPAVATVEGLSLLDFATSLAPKFFSWPLDKRNICHSLVHYMIANIYMFTYLTSSGQDITHSYFS